MLTEQAENILRDNSRGDYTIPTDKLYPFQWNWDSCFCALGWGYFDEPRAWEELHALFRGQWDNGMLPHIIFHQNVDTYFPGPDVWKSNTDPATSGISQPPVAATMMRMLYAQCTDKEAAEKNIKTLLPKLFAFHKWYQVERGHDGLIATYHPWETGRDNSAEWEEALYKVPTDNLEPYQRRDTDLIAADERPPQKEYDHYLSLLQFLRNHNYQGQELRDTVPFKIADIGINSILLRAHRDLLWLAEHLGEHEYSAEIKTWITEMENAFDRMWCPKSQNYCSYDLVAEKHIPIETSGSFLAFYAGCVPEDKQETMLNTLEHWGEKVKFMLPSLNPEDQYFDQKRYWRGPVWPIVNFMVATGLKECRHHEHADRIGRDTCALLTEHGFQEYFNPLDGQGLGGDHFSWAAATWLFWAQDFS